MARKTPAAPIAEPKSPAAAAPTPAPEPAPVDQPSDEQPTIGEYSDAPGAAGEPAQAADSAAPAAEQPVPELDDFIAGHEKAAQAVDLVVTAISHPSAKPGHRIGVYSGFPITAGPLEATYSDGSKH